MKKIILIALMLLSIGSTMAQVKVGNNPTVINPSAALEVESTNKGVLLPRLTTTERDQIVNPTLGLMIFNRTVQCTEVFIGIGTQGADAKGWKNQCRANIDATFQSSTLNCGGTLNGNFVATVPMNVNNYKVVTVTTLSAGDFTANTNEQNGVTFTATGTIVSIGAGTQIRLLANGVPFASGTFTYTANLSGQSCTFNVTFQDPPATLLDEAVNCNTSSAPAGIYTVGVPMAASNTKSVSVTPTGIGFCNLQTDVQNGISFSVSSTFVAGQLNTVQNLNLVASGTPATVGTFTYTVGGTNVTSGCTFTVTFACLKIQTGYFSNNAVGDKTFTFTTPTSGKVIYFANQNIWANSATQYICAQSRFNGTTITNNSFIAPSNPLNVYQSIPLVGEAIVSSGGTHTIDIFKSCGVDMVNNRLQYIFIPNPVGCSEGLTSGMFNATTGGFLNNTPTTGSHRYTINSPSNGRMILIPSLNMWTNTASNSLTYNINVNGVTAENVRQSNNTPTNVYQEVPGLAVANVSAGNVNVDLVPLAGFSGVANPSMHWIHIPSTSTISTGILSATSVNNSPSTLNHRFTLTAPSAGKYVLLGQASLWQNVGTSSLEYQVRTGSTVIETVRLNNSHYANAWQILTYATELNVAAAGPVNIDYIPTTGRFQDMRDVKLLWIFIPN